MDASTQRGNLDAAAQDGQLRVGLVALTMALGLAAFLDKQESLPMGLRSLVFIPLFVGAYGVLAAFYGVCGIAAASGKRRTPMGDEPVADRRELSSQRKTGALVVLMSAVIAAGATTALVLAT